MSTITARNKDFIQEYFDTLFRAPKTEQVIDRFVADPLLKRHILEAEAAFPGYQLTIGQMIAEDDLVAVRATMNATHNGPFAGINPTSRTVAVGCMLFYRITGERIVQHWMQLDSMSLVGQLTA